MIDSRKLSFWAADAMSEFTAKAKALWKEAAIWAVVAALILEFMINTFQRKTVWHRIDYLEYRVDHLEKIHEQDDLIRKQEEMQLRKQKEH